MAYFNVIRGVRQLEDGETISKFTLNEQCEPKGHSQPACRQAWPDRESIIKDPETSSG